MAKAMTVNNLMLRLIGKVKEKDYGNGVVKTRSALFIPPDYGKDCNLDHITQADKVWITFYPDKDADAQLLKGLNVGQNYMIAVGERKNQQGETVPSYSLLNSGDSGNPGSTSAPTPSAPPPTNGNGRVHPQNGGVAAGEAQRSVTPEERERLIAGWAESLARIQVGTYKLVLEGYTNYWKNVMGWSGEPLQADIDAIVTTVMIRLDEKFKLESPSSEINADKVLAVAKKTLSVYLQCLEAVDLQVAEQELKTALPKRRETATRNFITICKKLS